MITNLSRQRRYGSLGDVWSELTAFFRNVGGASITITVRDFQGNTSTQTIAKTPRIYVVGPAQYTYHFLPPTSTQLLLPGPHQGLYIREQEATRSADGNVWFRWEEDQPVIGVAPTSYSVGVF